MKELITMWRSTKMIVLVSASAAVYAAVLIPFKVLIPILPGFTEVRPASVIPIVCSLMFGPAAAWGSAIGNTIGDVLGGTLGLGTFFGFIGNFLYGYIPYRMWRAFGKGETMTESHCSTWASLPIALIAGLVLSFSIIIGFMRDSSYFELPKILMFAFISMSVFLVLRFLSVKYFMLTISASLACGVFIGWGVHLLGLLPFSALGNIIVVNNIVASTVLGPLLLPRLYPVVKRMELLYTDIMDEGDLSKTRAWGSVLMLIAVMSALIVGNWIAISGSKQSALESGILQTAAGRDALGLGLLPFIILILVSAAIM